MVGTLFLGSSSGHRAAGSHTASCSSTDFWMLFLCIQLAWGNKGKEKPEPVAQLIRQRLPCLASNGFRGLV